MTNHVDGIVAFMQKAGQATPEKLCVPSELLERINSKGFYLLE